MPVKCNSSGCRYGKRGKLYKGSNARAKAVKQGRAVKASQAKRRRE